MGNVVNLIEISQDQSEIFSATGMGMYFNNLKFVYNACIDQSLPFSSNYIFPSLKNKTVGKVASEDVVKLDVCIDQSLPCNDFPWIIWAQVQFILQYSEE